MFLLYTDVNFDKNNLKTSVITTRKPKIFTSLRFWLMAASIIDLTTRAKAMVINELIVFKKVKKTIFFLKPFEYENNTFSKLALDIRRMCSLILRMLKPPSSLYSNSLIYRKIKYNKNYFFVDLWNIEMVLSYN